MNKIICAALLSIGLLSAAVAAPVDVHLKINEKLTVFVRFDEKELRLALSEEELVTAQPINPSPKEKFYKDIVLPIPAEQLPSGVSSVRASFAMNKQAAGAPCVISLVQEIIENKDSKWTFEAINICKTAKVPGSLAYFEIPLPDIKKGELRLYAQPKSRALGVAIKAAYGNIDTVTVAHNGKPADVKLVIKDQNGKEVSSVSRPLEDFGMS